MIEPFFMSFGVDDEQRSDVTIIRHCDEWFLLSIADSGLFKYRSIRDTHIESDKKGMLFIKGVDMSYDI